MIAISFVSLFMLVFFIVLVIIGFSAAVKFARLLKRPHETRLPEVESVIKEREVIRQIVKIRCSYCSNLYDETYDNCPHCGGKRKA